MFGLLSVGPILGSVAEPRRGPGCGITKRSSGFLDRTGIGLYQASVESLFDY
jgi:hypothetical protein